MLQKILVFAVRVNLTLVFYVCLVNFLKLKILAITVCDKIKKMLDMSEIVPVNCVFFCSVSIFAFIRHFISGFHTETGGFKFYNTVMILRM
jgi:hypothetical protein